MGLNHRSYDSSGGVGGFLGYRPSAIPHTIHVWYVYLQFTIKNKPFIWVNTPFVPWHLSWLLGTLKALLGRLKLRSVLWVDKVKFSGLNQRRKHSLTRWFKPWPNFIPNVGGHQHRLWKGHKNSPSQKGHQQNCQEHVYGLCLVLETKVVGRLAHNHLAVYTIYISGFFIPCRGNVSYLPPCSRTRKSTLIIHAYIALWILNLE